MTEDTQAELDLAANVPAGHHPATGMVVAMGVTCACGTWVQGGRRTAGDDGLDQHRADVVSALARNGAE